MKLAQICRNEIKPKNREKSENHDFGDFENPLSLTTCVETLLYPTRLKIWVRSIDIYRI